MLDPKKRQLVFPSFSFQFKSTSGSESESGAFSNTGCVKRANEYITQWFKGDASDSIEFRGVYHFQKRGTASHTSGGKRKRKQPPAADDGSHSDSSSSSSSYSDDNDLDAPKNGVYESHESLYLVYEDIVCGGEDDAPIRMPFKSEWWWACVHEIFNTRRILFHRMGRNVTSLFENEPSALFLMNDAGDVYETPQVLYKGRPEEVSLDEMRVFGPRKCIDDNNVSASRERTLASKNINEILMHGSQYYFYEFCDAMRGACYTYDDRSNIYNKMRTGPCCMFRYVVFLGKVKTIMFDTDGATNHDRITRAHMFRELEWPMVGYNSIYHGKYKLHSSSPASGGGGRKRGGGVILYPAFSVVDVNRFIGASYHEVDPATIPDDINLMLKGKLVKFK
jgi:hypothetical protein